MIFQQSGRGSCCSLEGKAEREREWMQRLQLSFGDTSCKKIFPLGLAFSLPLFPLALRSNLSLLSPWSNPLLWLYLPRREKLVQH